MITVTLVLGIVAVGTLTMLTNSVQGMVLARNEATAAENIQAALTRITHEVANMDTKRAYAFTSNSITYYYKSDVAQSSISLSGNTIQLNNNVLLNNLPNSGGFSVTAPNYSVSPAVPVGITINANVPTLSGTVTRAYTARIELNTQRFQ
jgi:type II secretory pathway pseudopilin PulG